MKTPDKKKTMEKNSIKELLEENRISLETVQKAQDKIKSLERQMSEKNVLLKVMEDRLRPNLLERSLKDKDTTIKHLEMQIVKIIGENKILESQLAKAESENICKICKRNLVEPFKDQKRLPKSFTSTYRPSSRATYAGPDRKSASKVLPQSPNRIKTLERIITHKDDRIAYLSKEVHRLSDIEKELINKVNRLSKLLPASHLSSEKLTECLLREIQLLEAQIQNYKDSHSKIMGTTTFKSFSDPILRSIEGQRMESLESVDLSLAGKALTDSVLQKKIDRLDWELKASAPEYDVVKRENEALQSCLRKLYRDIYELKFLLAEENQKMRQEIDGVSSKSDMLKVHWDEVINRLNDISDNIEHITQSNSNVMSSSDRVYQTDAIESEATISRLQEKLRETLELVTEYETENRSLKGSIDNLKAQIAQTEEDHNYSVSLFRKQLQERDSALAQNSSKVKVISSLSEDDIEKFNDLLNIKQAQVNAADRHITQCEKSVERMKDVVSTLEAENFKLQSELNELKGSRQLKDTQRRLEQTTELLEVHKKKYETLQAEMRTVEVDNSELQAKLHMAESKNMLSEVTSQQKLTLEKKLDTAEKHMNSYENSLEALQATISHLKEEKAQMQAKLEISERKKLSYDTNEQHMVSLQTQLIKTRDENQDLKQSLLEFENKVQEMNHYRNILHREIENLCQMLNDGAEDVDGSSQRRAIYRAAVLHSAQALLRLDQNFNPKALENTDALDEMKHQVQVYIAEVARIHELLTIKEQQREQLLREYLNLNNGAEPGTTDERAEARMHFQGESEGSDLEASQIRKQPPIEMQLSDDETDKFNKALNASIVDMYRKGSQVPNVQTSAVATLKPDAALPNKIAYSVEVKSSNKPKTSENQNKSNDSRVAKVQFELMNVKEELSSARGLSSYLISSCTRLEEALEKERTDHAKADFEMQALRENVKDLHSQIQRNSSVTKRLNTLIEMLRSRESSDDITMEQLKSEIKWLMDENQKTFERITSTQTELSECKEINSRAQNEIDVLKRQLLNEKYEHAKVNSDLKHLRQQITNTDSDGK